MVFSLLFIFLVCTLLVVVVMALHARLKRLTERLVEYDKAINTLSQEVRALMSADIMFGKSVTELNRQLMSVDERQNSIQNERHNDAAYEHALKILSMGGTKEELIEACHLSSAEAELLTNLHTYRELTPS